MVLSPLPHPTKFSFFVGLFIPSSFKSAERNSPKWLNSQWAKAVNDKNLYLTERRHVQTKEPRAMYSKTIKMVKNILSNPSTINHILPSWLLLLFIHGQSCLPRLLKVFSPPPLKTNMALLQAFLHSRPIFQSLLSIHCWMTKGPNLIKISQCPPSCIHMKKLPNPSPAEHH